jgi:sensor histidine kinase YesM
VNNGTKPSMKLQFNLIKIYICNKISRSTNNYFQNLHLAKVQLISEESFLVFRYSKKPTKFVIQIFAPAKKWLEQKIKAFDDTN